MKQFDLAEYFKNPSRKVVTRDGKDVKIHCTNCIGSYPVIAEIEGEKYSYYYDKNGENFCNPSISGLFFAPEKHERWINIYRDTTGVSSGTVLYDSREKAEEVGKSYPHYVATAKVEWEE